MPKRTDISSILVIGAGLVLYGCGNTQTSHSEQVSFGGERPASVSECVDGMAKAGEIWSDGSVRTSFVYDVTELGLTGAKQFWKRSPDENGENSMTIHQGDVSDRAISDFLRRAPEGETEMFATEGLILVRINDDAARPFDAVMRTGCERLRDGVTIRQYTISRGNS